MKISRFRDPQTGYEENIEDAGLWCLLFGSIYFAVKGVWSHAVISLVLACSTFTLSWFVYPFFARGILERHYQRRGWVPVDFTGKAASGFRQCPFCAETVRAEAIVCRHCRSDLSAAPAREDAVSVPVVESLKSGTASATPAPPRRGGRVITALVALVAAALSVLAYWQIMESGRPFDDVIPELWLAGLAMVILVLLIGCWLRRQRPGLLELAAVTFAWLFIVAGATQIVMFLKSRDGVGNEKAAGSTAKPAGTSAARRGQAK
jgi:hypothetical protein